MREKLPVGWEFATLGDLGQWSSGGTPSRGNPDFYGGRIPWVKTGELKDCHITLTEEFITEEGLANSSAKLFPPGTLLVAMYGATIGQLGVLDVEAATNQACAALLSVGLTKEVIPYIFHYLLACREDLKSAGQGGAQPNINQGLLKEYSIPLAPLNEQRRIVAKIEALFERSQRARQALDAIPPLIDKLRQSILAAAFRGDLTADWRAQNPDVEPAESLLQRIRAERRLRWEQAELTKLRAKGKELRDGIWKANYKHWDPRGARLSVAVARAVRAGVGEIPRTWATVHLGEVAELQGGYPFKSSLYSKSGIRLLRGTNIVPGGTRWEDVVYIPNERRKEFFDYELSIGDLVIAMDRPLISAGLKVALLDDNDIPALLLQRVGRIKPESQIPSRFFFYFLNSPFFVRHVADQSTGTQLPHLSGNDIESVLLPLPPLEEQEEMLVCLDAAFAKLEILEHAYCEAKEKLASQDTAILAKAFRGELVPQDPEDEPASVLLERIRAARQSTPSTKRGKRARAAAPDHTAPATPRARSARPRPEPAPGPEQKTAPEPTAKPEPTHKNAPGPAQTALPLALADHDPGTIQDAVFAALWGRGALALDAAVRTVAGALRGQGLVHYNKLRADGALYAEVEKAIHAAARAGRLDRPRRGHVRAVASNARDYTTDDWRMALLAALDSDSDSDSDGNGNGQPVARDQAIARTAAWARDNMGLAFKRLRAGGVIESGIKSAINSAIRRGELERMDATHIRRRP